MSYIARRKYLSVSLASRDTQSSLSSAITRIGGNYSRDIHTLVKRKKHAMEHASIACFIYLEVIITIILMTHSDPLKIITNPKLSLYCRSTVADKRWSTNQIIAINIFSTRLLLLMTCAIKWLINHFYAKKNTKLLVIILMPCHRLQFKLDAN